MPTGYLRRLLLGVMVAATAVFGSGGVGALASTGNWQFADGSAQGSGGLASFSFAVLDKAHLLYNAKDSDLLGQKAGSTMTATFTVADVSAGAAFTYSGQGTSTDLCKTPASVRLYFDSTPPGSQFAYTNYWWADVSPASAVLANGTLTLTAFVDPAGQWSDWNGKLSADNAPEFTAAANNMTAVGLSFGGGCFFENGVGTTDGSGSFTLSSFSS